MTAQWCVSFRYASYEAHRSARRPYDLFEGDVFPALRRYYEFITDPTPNFRKLGFFAWIYMALAIIETLIVIKVRVCSFQEPICRCLPLQ